MANSSSIDKSKKVKLVFTDDNDIENNIKNDIVDLDIDRMSLPSCMSNYQLYSSNFPDDNRTHWIFRVNDGVNFKNSKYPFWGIKAGRNDCIKSIVKKMKQGDICWFLTSKPYGGKIIGMSEYTHFHDRRDEPLLQIYTMDNNKQNWNGNDSWVIQIHYINLYITEKQNINAIIQNSSTILNYSTFRHLIKDDLTIHYKNFKYYAEPIQFNL
jgi:hypothetical protein